MLFNSLDFALFLPIVFILYWFATKNNFKLQNILLLFASYFFYACWDYRFLFLLMFSTLLDYFSGIKIFEAENKKKRICWLWLSICINLGFLGYFKYYNFFISSFAEGFTALGMKFSIRTLQIILPVGISFYTFHGLSYVIDIYKKRIKPEHNFINYAVFVSFFPLLIAGPIERATNLLPQVIKKREFDHSKAVDGLRQILWGLFKKIVIADNCAVYADAVFNNYNDYSGITLFWGALFFAFQIYCDFSGYTDIAIGTARLFGINLLRSFSFPYFSRNIAEFWRRWNISLSTWFRDYLYIPLGGSKGGVWMKTRNIFIIFLVSGFWHGANWTFIAWGLINAIYILPSVLVKTNRNNLNIVAQGRYLPNLKELLSMVVTFSLTVFAWIFFRAENIEHATGYISKLFSFSAISKPFSVPVALVLLIAGFVIVEWQGREQQYAIADTGLKWPKIIRWAMYYGLALAIFYFTTAGKPFIYFQF
ncbi:MAG: MBOAT family O-acyltransferase [Ferruginibacter sp.]